MAKRREDIPERDDDFYTFIKNIVEILEEKTETGGVTQENWKHWLIPEVPFKELKDKFTAYEKDYLKAQNKKDRTSADVSKHRNNRNKIMEPATRQFIREHLRNENIIPDAQKVYMALSSKAQEPGPGHGSHLSTGALYVNLTSGFLPCISFRAACENPLKINFDFQNNTSKFACFFMQPFSKKKHLLKRPYSLMSFVFSSQFIHRHFNKLLLDFLFSHETKIITLNCHSPWGCSGFCTFRKSRQFHHGHKTDF